MEIVFVEELGYCPGVEHALKLANNELDKQEGQVFALGALIHNEQEMGRLFGKGLSASQQMLTDQVDGSRDQLAGVNLDEEMLAMVQYQRGFEAASRVLTTVDSVLDTLINRTGLLR